MFKDFMLKMAVDRALKNIPPEKKAKLMDFILQNKDSLTEIAKEVAEEQKSGKSMEEAMKVVLSRRGGEMEKMAKEAGLI